MFAHCGVYVSLTINQHVFLLEQKIHSKLSSLTTAVFVFRLNWIHCLTLLCLWVASAVLNMNDIIRSFREPEANVRLFWQYLQSWSKQIRQGLKNCFGKFFEIITFSVKIIIHIKNRGLKLYRVQLVWS